MENVSYGHFRFARSWEACWTAGYDGQIYDAPQDRWTDLAWHGRDPENPTTTAVEADGVLPKVVTWTSGNDTWVSFKFSLEQGKGSKKDVWPSDQPWPGVFSSALPLSLSLSIYIYSMGVSQNNARDFQLSSLYCMGVCQKQWPPENAWFLNPRKRNALPRP